MEEISDDSADYGRWTKREVIRKVAILLLQWLSKLQDSYCFERPSVSGKSMPSLRILRNRVVLWIPRSFAVLSRFQWFFRRALRIKSFSYSLSRSVVLSLIKIIPWAAETCLEVDHSFCWQEIFPTDVRFSQKGFDRWVELALLDYWSSRNSTSQFTHFK